MEFVLAGIWVYIVFGGMLVAPSYRATSTIPDSDKKLARAILLIPFWGPVAIYYTIKLPLVGLWWVCKNAFKKEE